MDDAFQPIEPVLSHARERLRAGEPPDAIAHLIEAAATYLGLHRYPAYETYCPSDTLKQRLKDIADATHEFHVQPVGDCIGDADRMCDCLRILIQGATLEAESALIIEVFEEDKTPYLALSFDGPGRFPELLHVEGLIRIALEELGRRWTLATRGGRLDKAPNGLLLRLRGERKLPELVPEAGRVYECVERAAACCARGTADRTLDAVEAALAILDGEGPRTEPADIETLVNEVAADFTDTFATHGIDLETMFASKLPAVAIRRDRLRTLLINAFTLATGAVTRGGSMVWLFEYQAATRAIECLMTIEGAERTPMDEAYAASFRRVLEDDHGGLSECTFDRRSVTLAATLPDPVGRALDEWIPRFDVFSDRSQQMLRLLRSGGDVPPEDLILGGVLDEELRRWLMPKLELPATVNIAHELRPGQDSLPCGSPERLAKALAQIRRGKPRNEIAKPAYAAEILYAICTDERGRRAMGVEGLDAHAVERLCTALIQQPPDYAKTLRLIARAVAGDMPAAPT